MKFFKVFFILLIMVLFTGCKENKEKRKIEIIKHGYKTLYPGESEEVTYPLETGDSVDVHIDGNEKSFYCKGMLVSPSDTLTLYEKAVTEDPYKYDDKFGIPSTGTGLFIINNFSQETLKIYRYYVRIRWE